MTKLVKFHETGAPETEIEVTPEMIEAGVEEYSLFSSGDRGEWVVAAVYRAMEKMRRAKEAPRRSLQGR